MQDLALAHASEGLASRFSAFKTLTRLPKLVLYAVQLMWRAAPGALLSMITLQLLTAGAVAAELLIGKELVPRLISRSGHVAGDWPAIAAMGLLAGVLAFGAAAQAGPRRLLAERTVRYFNEQILRVASVVELAAFDTPAFYDRLQRAQAQAINTPLTISATLADMLGAIANLVGIGAVVLSVYPLLLPLILFGFVPLWLLSTRSSAELYSFSFGQAPYDRARFFLTEIMLTKERAKEVRTFDLNAFVFEKWGGLYDQRLNQIRGLVRRQVRRAVTGGLTLAALTVAVFALLAGLVASHQVGLAGAGTVAVAIALLGFRLQGLGFGFANLFEAALFLDDYRAFLRLSDEGAQEAGQVSVARSFGRLTVNHVSFAYPNSRTIVLEDISMHVDKGEVVALVGENGSGKTTLAKLLCHLYTPGSGSVRWDGIDSSDFDAKELRRHITVIFQDFVRYPLTVWENIAVGDWNRKEQRDQIERAAEQAGAAAFVRALPRGYDTVLGQQFEGGVDLSIGQWQRIALARSFFRDAGFLVLDEPTAALDPRAEQELFDGIRTLCHGRAVLLISHRFSTVRSADRIYVLRSGRIIEQGTHDDLMRQSGHYAELFGLQAAPYRS